MTLSVMVMKIVLALLISEGLARRLRVRLARERETRTGTVTESESIQEDSYIKCTVQIIPGIVYRSVSHLRFAFFPHTDLSVSTLSTLATTALSFRSLTFGHIYIFHFQLCAR